MLHINCLGRSAESLCAISYQIAWWVESCTGIIAPTWATGAGKVMHYFNCSFKLHAVSMDLTFCQLQWNHSIDFGNLTSKTQIQESRSLMGNWFQSSPSLFGLPNDCRLEHKSHLWPSVMLVTGNTVYMQHKWKIYSIKKWSILLICFGGEIAKKTAVSHWTFVFI